LLKTTICLVAVLMCAWVSSHGQNAGLRQWRVLQEGHVIDSCAAVNRVLFTPSYEGLYRFSAYLSLSSTMQTGTWTMFLTWTDPTRDEGAYGFGVNLASGGHWAIQNPSLFSAKVGTQVTIQIYSGSLPPDATCEAAYTIEKLSR
jgi:hypothetical protein